MKHIRPSISLLTLIYFIAMIFAVYVSIRILIR